MHAFVESAGVIQNGKLPLCNFVIKISEDFLQFLIVCCGCSPFSDLPNYVVKHSSHHAFGHYSRSSVIIFAVLTCLLRLPAVQRSAKFCFKTQWPSYTPTSITQGAGALGQHDRFSCGLEARPCGSYLRKTIEHRVCKLRLGSACSI